MDQGIDRQTLRDYAATYRLQVIHNTALDYFRGLTEDDELVIHGLKLTVPAIILQ